MAQLPDRPPGSLILLARALVLLGWLIRPLHAVWPWLLRRPWPVKLGLAAAAAGLLLILGSLLWERPGLVRGRAIRAKHLGQDFLAGLRMLVGGEIQEYTEMLVEARNESMRRMEAKAQKSGADAVTNVRFATSQVMAGAAELLACGTGVKLGPQA